MKILSIIYLFLFFLIFQVKTAVFAKVEGASLNSVPVNNVSEEKIFLQPALNGIISVYYDLNGTPYIYIKDYTRKDGTFVKGYYRSLPDKNKLNNWSSKGNTNPFTGKKGYEKP